MENFVLYHEIYKRDGMTMYKGRKKGTITYVAISCIDKGERIKVTNHVRLVFELEHKHVVKFFEWYETSNHLWLVTELCVGGTLAQLLQQDVRLPEEAVRVFGTHLVRGVHHMHCNELIYVDWHPSKIILAGDGSLKFFDFSNSKKVNEDPQDLVQRFFSSLNPDQKEIDELFARRPVCEYSAPEVLQGASPGLASDIWGLGCLIFEMFAGCPPFTGGGDEDDSHQLTQSILHSPLIVPRAHAASSHFTDLVQRLLTKQPHLRISLSELCAHPFWGGALDDICGPASSPLTRLHPHAPPTISEDESSSSSTVNDDVSFTLHLASRPCDNIRDTVVVEEVPVLDSAPIQDSPLDRHQSLVMLATSSSKEVLSNYDEYSKMLKDGRLKFDVKLIPVPPYSLTKWKTLRKTDKEKHLKQVEGLLRTVEKGPPSQRRLHLINYVAQLSLAPDVATHLLDCGLAGDLCRQLKTCSNQEVVARTCQALAVVFHHGPGGASCSPEMVALFTEVLAILCDILRDQFRCSRVKLCCVSVLGETMVKLAEASDVVKESGEEIPAVGVAINLLNRCLHRTEEVAVSLAAAKVLESLAKYRGSPITRQVLCAETAQQLFTGFKHATLDALKVTAIQALSRLNRIEPTMFAGLVDKVGCQGFLDNVHVALLAVQEGVLEMFLLTILSQGGDTTSRKLAQDSSVLGSAMRLLETSTSGVVRSKALLLVLLVCEVDLVLLKVATDLRLVLYMEREMKRSSSGEGSHLTDQAVVLLTTFLSQTALPTILTECCSALAAVQGRKHPSSIQTKTLRRWLPLLDAVVAVVSSPSLRSSTVLASSSSFCQCLGTLLMYVLQVDSGQTLLGPDTAPNFITHIMALVEASCHGVQAPILVSHLLLHLAKLTAQASNPDLRIIGLKLCCDVVLVVDSPMDSSVDANVLKESVESILFPQVPHFFSDPDPSAVYALRLIRHYLSLDSDGCIQACRSQGLPTMLIQLMIDHQSRVMSATVVECLLFVSAISSVSGDLLRDMLLDVDLVSVLCELSLEIGDLYHKEEERDRRTKKTVEVFQMAMDTLYLMSRLVSDVVRLALQSKKRGEKPDVTSRLTMEAEELLGAGKPLTECVDLLVFTVGSESADGEITDTAIKLLNQVVSLYGGAQIQHGLRDANLRNLCVAATNGSVSQRRTLLRILKRLLAASGQESLPVGDGFTSIQEMLNKLGPRCLSDQDSVSQGLLEDMRRFVDIKT